MIEVDSTQGTEAAPTPEDYFGNPDGWQTHLGEIRDWLKPLADETFDHSVVHTLNTFAERYGFEPIDTYKALEKYQTGDEDPRKISLDLHIKHATMVTLSPLLNMDQKVALLKQTSDSMTNAKHPVDGRKIIIKEISYWEGVHFRAALFDSRVPVSNQQFLYELGLKFRRTVPRVGFGTMMKKIATAEIGERVGSTIKAFAVLDSLSNRPTAAQLEAQREKAKQRAQLRFDRAVAEVHAALIEQDKLRDKS